MTHLPYVAATYVLGTGAPLVLAALAWQRLRQARRRLAAVDPRMGTGS